MEQNRRVVREKEATVVEKGVTIDFWEHEAAVVPHRTPSDKAQQKRVAYRQKQRQKKSSSTFYREVALPMYWGACASGQKYDAITRALTHQPIPEEQKVTDPHLKLCGSMSRQMIEGDVNDYLQTKGNDLICSKHVNL